MAKNSILELEVKRVLNFCHYNSRLSFDIEKAILKTKMKRISMDSHQSRPIDGGSSKVKYQNLLQDYFELQKVSIFFADYIV